jgi:hypothetical protein
MYTEDKEFIFVINVFGIILIFFLIGFLYLMQSTPLKKMSETMVRKKLVIVGDAAVGKVSKRSVILKSLTERCGLISCGMSTKSQKM